MTATSPTTVEEPRADERARAAASVRTRLDRVLWQRIEVRDGAVTAVVAGTRHRRPHQLRVGTAAALGLLDQGVPTVGRRLGGRIVIVCHCHAVRAEEIRTEVRLGAETVEVIGMRCGAGNRCGGCTPAIEAIVADESIRMRTAAPARH